jgi:excisionase family DNA binding protein
MNNNGSRPVPMMRVREVARRLDVEVKTVRRWLLKGALAGIKLPSGEWRVTEAALHDCLGDDGQDAD